MDTNFYKTLKKDEKAHFEGWDFSYIKERMKEELPPWNYIQLAKRFVKKSKSLLDIDTGGGENLLLLAPFPKKSFAVESYKPNLRVARRNLKRAGVKVISADSAQKLPFESQSMDLVLNRHGGLNVTETYRVLKKEGFFVTQQVDTSKNFVDLLRIFKSKPKWTFNNLAYRKKELENCGFKIISAKEWTGKITFKDVGAIVYLLKSFTLLVDNFSVDSHLSSLQELQKKLEKKGRLEFTTSRFLIVAKKI